MNRTLIAALVGAAAVVAVALVVWMTRAPAPTEAPAEQAAAEEIDTSRVLPMVLGNADARVKVVEYLSFTCPHCARYHTEVFHLIKENYIDTGKISFEMREVYFDRFGLWAGIVARCEGGTRYFGIVDQLFVKQREWTAGDTPEAVAGNLRRIGRVVGMTDEAMDTCLRDEDMARAMLAVYQANVAAQPVPGTPTFYIDGQQYSNMGYAEFSAILDEKLGQ